MKSIHAWTWLAAGVLAAGLNASYHDGGLRWAHQIVGRMVGQAKGVGDAAMVLASGHPEEFLAKTSIGMARNDTASCRLAAALAQVQTRIAHSETGFARFETMSAREEAQFARIEAARARVEANEARIEAQAAAESARVRARVAVLAPVAVRVPVVCPRIRVNMARPPMVHIPSSLIHIDPTGAQPI